MAVIEPSQAAIEAATPHVEAAVRGVSGAHPSWHARAALMDAYAADNIAGAVEALERILALTMDPQADDRSVVTNVNVAAYAALHMAGGQ